MSKEDTFTCSHFEILGYFKLSKQNYAQAIDMSKPQATLTAALAYLNLSPPNDLHKNSVTDIVQWGVVNWQRRKVPNNHEIQLIEHKTDYQFLPL